MYHARLVQSHLLRTVTVRSHSRCWLRRSLCSRDLRRSIVWQESFLFCLTGELSFSSGCCRGETTRRNRFRRWKEPFRRTKTFLYVGALQSYFLTVKLSSGAFHFISSLAFPSFLRLRMIYALQPSNIPIANTMHYNNFSDFLLYFVHYDEVPHLL